MNEQSATDLRQSITKYVLEHTDEFSDVPAVKDYVEQHDRLSKEITSAKKRGQRLAKAKEKYEPFEKNVLGCKDALKNAKSKLAKLFSPLGEKSFKAFLSGDIDELPLFADRLKLHKRVQELQQEHDDLIPSADAGLVQKGKAKAQQLVVKGKIKLEEMKVGGLITKIGQKIIDDGLDESVRCSTTEKLLDQIVKQRESLAAYSKELKAANAELEKEAKQLCESVPIQNIESLKTFDSELKTCKQAIRESKSSMAKATRSLTESLMDVESSSLPNSLVSQLNSLKQAKGSASEQIREAVGQLSEPNVPLLEQLIVIIPSLMFCFPIGLFFVWRNSWSSQKKWIYTGGFVVCFMVLSLMGIMMEQAAAKKVAEANSLWENGEQEKAIILYRELEIDRYIIPDGLRPIVYGRLIDHAAKNDNNKEVRRLLNRASRFTPDCRSDKSKRLIAQIEAEKKAEVAKKEAEKEAKKSTKATRKLAGDKVQAFKDLIEKLKGFDRLASKKENEEFLRELNKLSDKFSSIPFDPTILPMRLKKLLDCMNKI